MLNFKDIYLTKLQAITITKPAQIDVPAAGAAPGQAGLNVLIGRIVETALVVAGVFFLFMLIIGGLRWATAGGDKDALNSARGRITSSLIGLIIIVASFAIAQIAFDILGLKGVKIN